VASRNVRDECIQGNEYVRCTFISAAAQASEKRGVLPMTSTTSIFEAHHTFINNGTRRPTYQNWNLLQCSQNSLICDKDWNSIPDRFSLTTRWYPSFLLFRHEARPRTIPTFSFMYRNSFFDKFINKYSQIG